jgi:catechol-2,3-dioxygenase
LALFKSSNEHAFGEVKPEVRSEYSSLHHIAFEIDIEDREDLLRSLELANIDYRTEYFEWVNWQSIFIKDPEGNILEFVCYQE